eukprot:4780741-Prymnesium_polylepis.1
MTDANEIADTIEAEMHRHFDAVKDYNAKARSLLFNLKSSAELRERVVGRNISAHHLATCAPKDLAPAQLQLQRRESAERYVAQRSLGESSEQVVGWSAGTTGKLEWSHKYEKETLGAAAKAPAVDLGQELLGPNAADEPADDSAEDDEGADYGDYGGYSPTQTDAAPEAMDGGRED